MQTPATMQGMSTEFSRSPTTLLRNVSGSLQNINNVFLKHPEFVFDNFIYHSHNLRSRNIDETEWTDLHEKISYMFAFVINYLDEIEFDLFSKI